MWLIKVLIEISILIVLTTCDHDFKIANYKLLLNTNIHEGNSSFRASATILIETVKSLEFIKLHHGENLSNFEADVKDVILTSLLFTMENSKDFLTLKLQNKNFSQTTYYVINLSYDGEFPSEFIRHYNNEDVKIYFVTASFKSTSFKSICPSAKEDVRLNFDLSIKHHVGYHVLSNRDVLDVRNDGIDYQITNFYNATNVMTSSIGILISNFDSITSDSVKIYGNPFHIQEHYFNDALEMSKVVIEKFEALFSYQLGNLNQIAVPGILPNNLSTYSLIMHNEFDIFYRQNLSPHEKKDKILQHVAFAIAQQYFGNIITTTSWSDSFITEGLASFYEHFILSTESAEHENRIMKLFNMEILQKAFEIDSSLLAEPLMTSKLIPADEFNSFSRLKASCVMRMMESVIGSETFAKGVKNLLNYENKSITMELFYKELQAAVDEDDKNIQVKDFDEFMTQEGFPLIHVEIIDESSVKVIQEKFNLNHTDGIWNIPLTYMTSNGIVQSKWINEIEIIIDIPTDSWLLFNIDRIGYYRVNYDSLLWNHLINELATGNLSKIPTSNRAALINDAFSLALNERISYVTAFEVISYISRENNSIPWMAAHEELKFLDAMLFKSQIYDKFKNFIVDLITPFLQDILITDDYNFKSIILFWACQMRLEECTTLVNNSFNDYMENPVTFQPDDRIIVLCNAIKLINQKAVYNETMNKMLSIEGDKSDWIKALACIEEGYWLTDFLLLAYNNDLNLSTYERRQILVSALKNHKYGSMAGIELLARKTSLLSDGEIQFILDEVVKRFWDRNLVTMFERLNVNEIKIYLNLAEDRLEWLNTNQAEIEYWLDSWHEETTSTSESYSTTTEVTTTTEESTTTGSTSFIKINSPIIVLMIYVAINV